MKKNILFVSISFPPKSDPEGLQAAKYFHYLQRYQDLAIDVVTSAVPTLYMPYDPDLESYANGVRQMINIPLRENRYVNFLRDRLKLYETVFPDVKQSFHKQYKKAIKAIKSKPDLIYSRADPKSSTIMAYKLKMAFGVPWILHMSDPWADCPLMQLKGPYYRKSNEWERKCITAADLVSLTSVSTIEFYKKKYPQFAAKFRFFPNVFEYDEKAADEVENLNSGKFKFRIVYTGGLAGERSPMYLFKALRVLINEQPELVNGIEVIFAGGLDAKNRAVFQEYSLPFVQHVGMLPFRDALTLQRSADYLVVIDNPIEDPAMSMFFPSKLLDYMLARKRILAITTPGSASDLIMRDLKGDVCSHEAIHDIVRAILNAFSAYKNGDHSYLVNDAPPKKYEASYNAERLYHEMKNLLYV